MPRSTPSSATLPRPALRGLAVFCALTVWLLGILAGSAELHASLHKDAGLAEHSCGITLFGQGVENSVPPPNSVAAPSFVLVAMAHPVEPLRAALPSDRLPPGHGPPVR